MLNEILRSVGPIVAAAIAGKFENGEFRFDEKGFRFDSDWEGVPLDELDLTLGAPDTIVVAGSARVEIAEGKTFRVKVEGDGAESARFALRDDRLVIMRRSSGEAGAGPLKVLLTLPPVRALKIAGSGTIVTSALADEARISIAGSGMVTLEEVRCRKLKAKIMGSGSLQASGLAQSVKLDIAGSGLADMSHLTAEEAWLALTGSGSARIASDGAVDARITGTSLVTVYGRARCSVHSIGSGQLRCVPLEGRDTDDAEWKARTAKRKRPRDDGDEDGGASAPVKPPKPMAAEAKPDKPSSRRKKATAKARTAAGEAKAKKPKKAGKKKKKAPADKSPADSASGAD